MISRPAGVVGLTMALYVGACIAPALRFDMLDRPSQPHQIMRGYELLLLGWQAIFIGNFAWLANLGLFVSLLFLLLGGWKPAAIFAGVSLLLALQTLMLFGSRINADEGGVTHMTLGSLYVGFYVWLAAMVVVLLGSLWRKP
jgi:hypothetical protein